MQPFSLRGSSLWSLSKYSFPKGAPLTHIRTRVWSSPTPMQPLFISGQKPKYGFSFPRFFFCSLPSWWPSPQLFLRVGNWLRKKFGIVKDTYEWIAKTRALLQMTQPMIRNRKTHNRKIYKKSTHDFSMPGGIILQWRSKTDVAPWCYRWAGWMDGMDGSLGGVKYRAPYGTEGRFWPRKWMNFRKNSKYDKTSCLTVIWRWHFPV